MARVRLFVVPHTHYDAEVFLTRDVTLALGADNLLDALYLLDRDPTYRYVLDQRAYVEGFATLYPEQVARLKGHIASGRLQVAGSMHTMPDANLPCGESFVRQIHYGRAYLDGVLGEHDTTGWMLDSFGHHPQVPQLMRKAGFDTYVFQRGVSKTGLVPALTERAAAPDGQQLDLGGEEPAAFWWTGLDGSRLRCEWLPFGYGVLGAVPTTLAGFREVVGHLAQTMAPYLYNGQGVALAGLDLSAPDADLPDLIRRYNAEGHEVELVLATAREYFAAQDAGELRTYEGDLNPIFTGCYAARIALKQRNRAMENALFSAEKLSAINWAEQRRPVERLEDAWEPVLFNQFHDLICGSHLDAAYERAIDRYKRAAKRTGQVTDRALDALTQGIDTRGEGIPLVVLNLLSVERIDVARCTVALGPEAWESLALYDDQGSRVPLQVANVQRHPDGSVKRADLLFMASVPPLGYRTYFLRAGGDAAPATDLWVQQVSRPPVAGIHLGIPQPNEGRMGNSLLDVRASLRTGAIEALVLRELGWNAVHSAHEHGFATLCRQEDRGDPWEYYGPLRGSATGVLPLIDPVPPRGQAAFSDDYGGQGSAGGGPVMGEIEVHGPFGEGMFSTRLRIYAGLPRVDIITEVTNQQPFVRYRNVFPLNLVGPRMTYEIPFGALERPEGEYPAQNWVDVGDGERGLALLNRGIPGHSLVGSVLTSSLMKCTRVVSYQGGGYSKEAGDVAGFEIGVTHRFEQALLPHRGAWPDARLVQEGLAFNVPLIVRKATSHAGSLPAAGSFLRVEPDTMVLHALYVEGDRLILRLAEAAGRAGDGRVILRWPIASVEETDSGGHSTTVGPGGRDCLLLLNLPI